jgi:uncharacterized protein (DUF488 family)
VPDGILVHTLGHGTLSEGAYLEVVKSAGVEHIVDVRSYPASRHNPQYGRAQLEHWLTAAGVGYSWDPRLGGRRRPNPASSNVALHHPAFRAYADHMASDEFRAALDELVALATASPVAVMCAESVWWRCHRRLLADALVLLRRARVAHLFHDGRLASHSPAAEARVSDDHLVYDLGTARPLL